MSKLKSSLHGVQACMSLLQGFTREITLPRERWVGFIKDYDGGTLMECIIYPKVPYTDLVTAIRVSVLLMSLARMLHLCVVTVCG